MNDNRTNADAAHDRAPDPSRVAAIRSRIDALDETLHRALMERSGLINEMIVAKGSRASDGAVFRPGREASMMRALAARHVGSLPFAVIEHMWRIVIASHTALQQPFAVFVDVSSDPLPSWDAARRLVGFAVPVEPCGSPDLVIEAMADVGPSLGLVPLANGTQWWRALGGDGPRVMARLPMVEGGEDAPHFVLSPALSDPVPFEVPITRVTVAADTDPGEAEVLTAAVLSDGREEWLVAGDIASITGALDPVDCGGYHRPIAPPTTSPSGEAS